MVLALISLASLAAGAIAVITDQEARTQLGTPAFDRAVIAAGGAYYIGADLAEKLGLPLV